jgi:hypothetical protein
MPLKLLVELFAFTNNAQKIVTCESAIGFSLSPGSRRSPSRASAPEVVVRFGRDGRHTPWNRGCAFSSLS